MKYNIEAKASMHVGKKYSLKHNLREYDANKWNTDGHIQSDRSHLNERLTHTELRDFFQKTFGAAIDQYNEKNREKHPDRMTSVDDYYNKYKGHAQECIMQMGDHENYMELIKLVGQEKADYIHKQFLTRAYKNWLKDKVFSIAPLKDPNEWIKAITGKDFSTKDYINYLYEKFSKLYKF